MRGWILLCDQLVLLAGGITVGWYAHLWLCMRRKGCILYRQASAQAWTDSWTGRYPNGRHERHPTGPVPVEPQALDEARKSGVPSREQNTPVTGVANPRRKT
jgi:hypothetical protein